MHIILVFRFPVKKEWKRNNEEHNKNYIYQVMYMYTYSITFMSVKGLN